MSSLENPEGIFVGVESLERTALTLPLFAPLPLPFELPREPLLSAEPPRDIGLPLASSLGFARNIHEFHEGWCLGLHIFDGQDNVVIIRALLSLSTTIF